MWSDRARKKHPHILNGLRRHHRLRSCLAVLREMNEHVDVQRYDFEDQEAEE